MQWLGCGHHHFCRRFIISSLHLLELLDRWTAHSLLIRRALLTSTPPDRCLFQDQLTCSALVNWATVALCKYHCLTQRVSRLLENFTAALGANLHSLVEDIGIGEGLDEDFVVPVNVAPALLLRDHGLQKATSLESIQAGVLEQCLLVDLRFPIQIQLVVDHFCLLVEPVSDIRVFEIPMLCVSLALRDHVEADWFDLITDFRGNRRPWWRLLRRLATQMMHHSVFQT